MGFSKDFSKRELVSILETIEGCRSCLTPSDLRGLVLKAGDLLEADYSICGLGRVSGGEVRDVEACINGNYPEEWLDVYLSEKLFRVDPVVRYLSNFSLTDNWRNILGRFPQSDPLIRNAWDFGLRHGVSTSVFIPGGDVSIFSFSGKNDTFKSHHEKIIDILVLHLNGALLRAVAQRISLQEESGA